MYRHTITLLLVIVQTFIVSLPFIALLAYLDLCVLDFRILDNLFFLTIIMAELINAYVNLITIGDWTSTNFTILKAHVTLGTTRSRNKAKTQFS